MRKSRFNDSQRQAIVESYLKGGKSVEELCLSQAKLIGQVEKITVKLLNERFGDGQSPKANIEYVRQFLWSSVFPCLGTDPLLYLNMDIQMEEFFFEGRENF
jgi:hypothetical protein